MKQEIYPLKSVGSLSPSVFRKNPLINQSLTAVANVEMPRRKVFGNETISPDRETMMRDALSPGGTFLGTQTLADTPHKQHKAWQYKVPPERHRWGGRGAPQSQRDVLPRRSQKGKTRRRIRRSTP